MTGSEELRQNVFSSIHMSTIVKSAQATVTYPCCSFCGGMDPKGSPKPRKVVLAQFSLYTNPSESFVVWCKKQDEPKGMLWVRSFCIRKGEGSAIELISRGCRGRCSYTLKFSAASEEWYRLLRQESRRAPSLGIGDETSTELQLSPGNADSFSLDSMLTEISPTLSYYGELESDDQGENYCDRGLSAIHEHSLSAPVESSTVVSAPLPTKSQSGKKIKKSKHSASTSKLGSKKLKPVTVTCNPLQGIGRRKSIPNYGGGAHAVAPVVESPSAYDDLSRWSWPLKA